MMKIISYIKTGIQNLRKTGLEGGDSHLIVIDIKRTKPTHVD